MRQFIVLLNFRTKQGSPDIIRSSTCWPGDATAYDFDSVGAVATRSPGAATAYMTVEKEEKKEEAKGLS